MAREQKWTRNISKKPKAGRTSEKPRGGRSIVGDDPLESLRRRAEDLGLIIHSRPGSRPKTSGGKKGGGK